MGFVSTIKSFFQKSTGDAERQYVSSQSFEEKWNDTGVFSYGEEGFAIQMAEGEKFYKWDDIEELVAEKVDLYT